MHALAWLHSEKNNMYFDRISIDNIYIDKDGNARVLWIDSLPKAYKMPEGTSSELDLVGIETLQAIGVYYVERLVSAILEFTQLSKDEYQKMLELMQITNALERLPLSAALAFDCMRPELWVGKDRQWIQTIEEAQKSPEPPSQKKAAKRSYETPALKGVDAKSGEWCFSTWTDLVMYYQSL
jgi:hypothetical protein